MYSIPNGNNWVPNMPGFSDWATKDFADMRTIQEQVWWLYARVKGMQETDETDGLADRVSALEKSVSDTLAALADALERLGNVQEMMLALAQNGLAYDVTRGTYAPSIAAERRMWQAQMFSGMTVADLAQVTVAQAQLMNVRHVAVDGREEYMGLGKAAPELPEQGGWTEPDFRPDAYVKKSDFVLIDTDNLADHEIMGVLKSVAESKCPTPAPYFRRGTTVDLRNLTVRSDGDLYSFDPTKE